MKRNILFNKSAGLFFSLIFFTLSLGGCAICGKPSYDIKYYLLNYTAPAFENLTSLDSTLSFNRFTIAAAYNTQNMIFRADDHSIDFLSYNRWAVNPADMVADTLLRDMQASGIFSAVFSRLSMEEANFVLQGGIEEFYLRVEENRKVAVISLGITLKDSRKREVNRRILFQKKYHYEEQLTQYTPRGYSEAMSKALQAISSQIIYDVYRAAR
ncbi:MAG TPA: hypothetical protein ENN23_10280 [Deltaproteobacteria bacterium]|nr:hypothetical protein [Deltaproteobacteria bacterium]